MEKGGNRKHGGIFIQPISLLIIITSSIFASATLVNLILSVFSPLSLDIKLSLMVAGLMVIILFPVMYFLVYEPLTSSIKDLNESEEALQESEAKFRSLVETTDDSIYLVDRNCEYLFMNTKYRSRRGIVFDGEYKGKAYRDFHSPEETRIFDEKVTRIFETGESLQQEYRSPDGKYFLRTLSPIKGPNGNVAAVNVVSKDITRLMRGGEVELRYRAVFEQSPFGILIIDTDGKIIEFNETARRELGYSREEFARLHLSDINPQSAEEIRNRIKEVLSRGGYEFDVKHMTKSGELRDVHVIARVLDLFGHKVFQAIWQDITEQKRCEEALRSCHEQLDKLISERGRSGGGR
jgi:PAS domain S-box-containing protein